MPEKREKTFITETQAIGLVISVISTIANAVGLGLPAALIGGAATAAVNLFTWWRRSKMKKDVVEMVMAEMVTSRPASEVKAGLKDEIDKLKAEIDKKDV